MPQLMTKEEIHEFGLQILSRYLEANAYEIEMMHVILRPMLTK